MIRAQVVCDSVNALGQRLTTLEVTFHRLVLSEFNTHRAFSRNSASSRARSVTKTLQEVRDNPAVPIEFRREKRGMSGGELLEGDDQIRASLEWQAACLDALDSAQRLVDLNVHKSIVNRLVEPFMWHTAVVTATDWDGFFAQRLALLDDGVPASQPEMYELARQMKIAIDMSDPLFLSDGDWHLPYVTDDDIKYVRETTTPFSTTMLCQISVARCAGVSYLTQGSKGRDIEKDVALYRRLYDANPTHWSPFEHVASPVTYVDEANQYWANFHGWKSLRYTLERDIPRT